MIRIHLLKHSLWSILVILNSCHSTNKKSIAEKKEADTVIINFYNASVAPPHQFYTTIQIVNAKYYVITQKDNSGNFLKTTNSTLPQGMWPQVAIFEPSKLNEQNNSDGETLMIEYHCTDSTYRHFPEQNSPSWAQITRLFQLHK